MKYLPRLLLAIFLSGCAAGTSYDRVYVSQSLDERGAGSLTAADTGGGFSLPAGVNLSDGITEREAVAAALWSNAQFQADLLELGFARADLQDASLFTNPVLSFLFPAGPKQMEASLSLAFAEIWQRPSRTAAARLDAARVAENLVQHGLGLAREVRICFAEAVFAGQRAQYTREKAKVQSRIDDIARVRLRAGDISPLEAATEYTLALKARDEAIRFQAEAEAAVIRLHTLIGWTSPDTSYELRDEPVEVGVETEVHDLLRTAYAARPDLRAAELRIEAAAKRLGWERSRIFNLIGILDANETDGGDWEMGPGLQVDLPLFNLNQGGRTRAHAELEQSARQYIAERHRISLEVREAQAGHRAMQEVYGVWHGEILPAQEKALERAARAYQAGEESLLYELLARRQLLEDRVMETRATTDLRRARADLEHSIGKNLQ